MAFGITTFAIIAAATTVAGGVASAAQGGQTTTGTSTTKLEFPEETRRLFQDVEEPLIKGFQDEQASLLQPFLGGFGTRPALKSQYGGTENVVKSAARKGAGQAGISDLGPVFDNIEGLTPELIGALQGLVTTRGQQINTVVPAGFGQFLSPSTFSQQSGAGSDPFQTGFQLAGSTASLLGALSSAGAFA